MFGQPFQTDIMFDYVLLPLFWMRTSFTNVLGQSSASLKILRSYLYFQILRCAKT